MNRSCIIQTLSKISPKITTKTMIKKYSNSFMIIFVYSPKLNIFAHYFAERY